LRERGQVKQATKTGKAAAASNCLIISTLRKAAALSHRHVTT